MSLLTLFAFSMVLPSYAAFAQTVNSITAGRQIPGTVFISYPQGRSFSFPPAGSTRADRGAALVSAFNKLSKMTARGQGGGTLNLSPGSDYEIGNLEVTQLDHCTVQGNGATIWSTEQYDFVLRITNSKHLAIQNLKIRGATRNNGEPANGHNGRGLVIHRCDRLTIHDCEFSDHSGRRNHGHPEFANNVFSYGLQVTHSDDVLVNQVRVNRNGKYGIECRELARPTFRDVTGNNNGRQILNVVNQKVDPKTLWIERLGGYGDEDHQNTLLSGCPGVSVGSGVYWPKSKCVIRNARIAWTNVGQDRSSLGKTYAAIKATDYETVILDRVEVRHTKNRGTADAYSLAVRDVRHLKIANCEFDSDIRSLGGAVQELLLLDSKINRKRHARSCLSGFKLERAIVRGSHFWFGRSAFDFRRSTSCQLELMENRFHGPHPNGQVLVIAPSADRTIIAANNRLENCQLRN